MKRKAEGIVFIEQEDGPRVRTPNRTALRSHFRANATRAERLTLFGQWRNRGARYISD